MNCIPNDKHLTKYSKACIHSSNEIYLLNK